MSDVITHAVTALNERLDGAGFDGVAKFVIEDEGAIVLDESGARAGDDEADVTMTADTDTFRAIIEGKHQNVMKKLQQLMRKSVHLLMRLVHH